MWTPPADQVETVDTGWKPPADQVVSGDQSASTPQGQPSNAGLESVAQPIRDAGNAIAPYAQQALSQPDVQPFPNQGINPFTKPTGGPIQQVLGSMRQIASLPLRYSASLGQASQPVANWVAEKGGASGDNPYLDAMGGTIAGALADPRSYVPTGGISSDPQTELPDAVAQAREARTGVPAGQFQRLYKDPGAIFAGQNVDQAGEAIGAAKVKAGVNMGITEDPASLTPENLAKIKSPITTAKNAIDTVTEQIANGEKPSPDQAAQALTGVNNILGKVKPGTPAFQQWTMVKTHLNNALGEVAPDVQAANQAFAREKLGEDFSGMNPVNKNGNPSKLAMMARGASTLGGAVLGHLIPGVNSIEGGAVGAAIGKYGSMAFHSPYIAGLQTAAGAVANNAIDPILGSVQSGLSSPLMQAYIARYLQQKGNQQ